MKRPILIVVVGYIIGIIIGLYFKISIALFYIILLLMYYTIKMIYSFFKKEKFSFYSISRYMRYIKLFINKKVIVLIIISSFISNFIINQQNKYYDEIYKTPQNVIIIGKIEELIEENEYQDKYKLSVKTINGENKNISLYLIVNNNKHYKYGDFIEARGDYIPPKTERNYGGFNYRDYLKTKGIYGTVKSKDIRVIHKQSGLDFGKVLNDLRGKIKNNAKKYLPNEISSIYLGLILGDTSFIEEDVLEHFRNSNMAHILAVSGMHISYIVIGMSILLNRMIGKRKGKILSIIIIILYNFITGFSPSIIRASIMAILILISGLLYRKDDIWNSLSISLLLILIYNPFLITSIGLQYSYLGTIGITLFYKTIIHILTKKSQKFMKIKQIISLSISSLIFILPLTIYYFNTFGIYFILTNLLLTLIMSPLIIYCFLFLILLVFNVNIIQIIAFPIKIGIQALLCISDISKLPFSKIYLRTPKVFELVMFYIIIIIISIIYKSQSRKKLTNTGLRLKLTYHLFKYRFKIMNKKVFIISIIILSIVFGIIMFKPKDLRIHFIDVGQGDSCFIETPFNKTILIDGGGNEFGDFDVGKSVVLPYILDRGYTKLDYILISHFDTDHIGRNFDYYGRIRCWTSNNS